MRDARNVRLGPNLIELAKSALPAGLADNSGAHPFFCSSPEPRAIDQWLVEGEAVVLGTGGVASVNFGRGKFAYSTDCWAFQARRGELSTEYLYRVLQHQLPKIDYAGFEGSGLRHLRKDFIREMVIGLPEELAQARTTRVLAAVDDAIEQTEALIAKTQAIKAGLMHDLFTRGVTASGELRPPCEEAPELYKASSLGWIPKEWNEDFLSKFLQGTPKNGYSPVEVSEWHGMYALGLGCLTKDGFKGAQLKFVLPGSPLCRASTLVDGDLLISRSNTRELVGLCGVFRDIGAPCIYPDLMMRLSPNRRSSAAYLESLLLSSHMRRQITGAAVGTSGSMVKLNARAVMHLRIAIPQDTEEQAAILSMAGTQREVLATLNSDLAKMERIKQGLMHDLLTDRVPAPKPEALAAGT